MSAALELIGLTKNFGLAQIIRDVSLEVETGERHAIIGPNGAGKSTLFHIVSGRIAPTSGEIRLKGARIDSLEPFEIYRRGLARSFQITNIFPRLSVYENLRCATLWSLGYKYAFWTPIDRLRDVREKTEWLMKQIGLTARRDVQAGVLSYAEQRSLEIGVTVAGGANVILLDEPTAGMNAGESAQAVALVRKVCEGKTLVIVEHDMGVVFGLADRISVLVYGRIVASDTPERIRENAEVQEAFSGTGPADEDAAARGRRSQRLLRQEPHSARRDVPRRRERNRQSARAQRRRPLDDDQGGDGRRPPEGLDPLQGRGDRRREAA